MSRRRRREAPQRKRCRICRVWQAVEHLTDGYCESCWQQPPLPLEVPK